MLQRQDHSRVVPKAKSSRKTEKPERRWTTFLDPGPSRSGKCSWRRHFVGVPAAVMGYLQNLAAKDQDRFVFATISAVARRSIPGRSIDRGYLREVFGQFQERGWIESKMSMRHGRKLRGWRVRTHEAWMVTLSSQGGNKVTTKCGLSHQGVVTKSPSEKTENRSQTHAHKGHKRDGGGAEPSTEPSTEPASELTKSACSLLARIGFDGNIKSTKLLEEIGKLAQAKWTRKEDGMKLGIERVTDRQLARHCARWRDKCDEKQRKLPVELIEAITWFDNDASVLKPSELLPEDW